MLSDLRFGLRNLYRTPYFTLTALVALALGIGANTAIFSVVSPVLFRPLPYPEAEKVLTLQPYHLGSDVSSNFSLPTYQDYLAQTKQVAAMAALRQGAVAVSTDGEAELLRALFGTPSLFKVLGIEPELGRVLVDADDDAGAPPVVVLSHAAWVKTFKRDPGVLGRTVMVDAKPFTVVGVMPAVFSEPAHFTSYGVYLPLSFNPDVAKLGKYRGHHNLVVVARAVTGRDAVLAESEGIFAAIEKENPDETGLRTRVYTLHETMTDELRPAALVLSGAVLLVLLIACANVAGLLVVRAGSRQREIAIRLALGAGRGRVVRQVLTESVLLSLLGAGLGLLVAMWTLDGLKALLGSRLGPVGLDGQVLAFTALVGVLTGLLFGAVPALHASRVGVHEALKDAGNRASQSKRRRRLQAGLVAVQVALAFALLAGAGLMFQSVYALMHVNPGFTAEGLISLRVRLPGGTYDDARKRAFYRRMLDEAAALPGVVSVASGDPFPFLDGNSRNSVHAAGQPDPKPGEEVTANMYEVSEGYFETMRIPMKEGRTFNVAEREEKRAIVVSEKLAQKFWPGESALGKRFYASGDKALEVIGVVGDVRHGSLERDIRMAFYVPFEHSQWVEQRLLVRTQGDPEAMVPALRRLVRTLDPTLPVPEPELATDTLEQSASSRRITLYMLAAFAAVALLLSALGLWGLIAFAVGQRKQELAIRSALGASPGHLIGLVLRQGVWLIGGGLAVGLALAVGGSQLLRSLLYGVQPVDALTYSAIALTLGSVALVACYLPARAATKVDPNVALRA